MHVSRYKQWEVLPASKFSGKWFKFAVGNELLESRILGVLGKDITEDDIKEAEKQGYEVIDVPLEMQHRFEMDMNRTLIDTCGIAIQSSYKYIPYRIVQPCLGTGTNPFKSEVIKTGLKDQYQISDFFMPELVPEMIYSKKIYIHCDLSKSGDMTGISAVAVLGYKNQERFDDTGGSSTLKEIVFRHVFSVGIKCPANDELSMIKVKDFLHYLKYDLGWNIVGVSCDGYQSLMLLQSLAIDSFTVKEVSMDIVKNKEDVGYTVFRNTLVEQRIKLLDLYELTREITNLEKNETTGKVDHPRQCLVGNTKIRMLNGNYKTILDLIIDQHNNIKNYVYTFNEKTKTIEPKLIKNVWQTGYRKDLYKITLDNNENVICTGNHPFMLRNGEYLEAEKLHIGQSLMPLYTKISGTGLKGYRIYYEPVENKWHYELTTSELYKGGTLFRNMLKPELKTKGTDTMRGYKWFTNGEKSIYLASTDKVPEGFYRGRKIKNHKIIKIEKLNYYQKVYDLEIEDNHNFALDCGIFVHNSVKVVNGETIKSVGKDISDSLGGAIYNATLSVDVNELDFMEGVTIAEGNVTLNTGTNMADQFFGFMSNGNGSVQMLPNQTENIDEQISNEIQKQFIQSNKIVQQIQNANPNSKLSANQIKDMYKEFSSDGMILF